MGANAAAQGAAMASPWSSPTSPTAAALLGPDWQCDQNRRIHTSNVVEDEDTLQIEDTRFAVETEEQSTHRLPVTEASDPMS